jgi:hypothetical protein
MLCETKWYNPIQCYKTQYNTAECDAAQCNAVQCNTIQYSMSHCTGHAGPCILYSTQLRQPSARTGTGTGMRLIILTAKMRACVVAFYSSDPPLPPCTRQARSVYHTLTSPTTPNTTQPKPTWTNRIPSLTARSLQRLESRSPSSMYSTLHCVIQPQYSR